MELLFFGAAGAFFAAAAFLPPNRATTREPLLNVFTLCVSSWPKKDELSDVVAVAAMAP